MRIDNHCPFCKRLTDAQTCVSEMDAEPKPNDLSLCAYCGELAQFDENLKLVSCSDEVLDQIDLIHIQHARQIRAAFLDRKAEDKDN